MKITEHGIAIVETDKCICKWVEESGRLDHDQGLLPFVLKHIHPGDVVIDAGAFIGDHTLAYSRQVGSTGKVYAFEPSTDSYNCLIHNMKFFNVDNVISSPFGLGAESKTAAIAKVTDENIGMNFLVEGNDVHVITIDSQNYDRVDFIKMDVEGYEMQILQGAVETLKRCKPKMLIEINQMALERFHLTREDIFQFLENMGYSYNHVYAEHGYGLNEYQYDLLCIPK